METKRFRGASLFSGMGGICLAFKQAGFDIVWANDIDRFVCKTYRLNFGDEYLVEGDIKSIDLLDKERRPDKYYMDKHKRIDSIRQHMTDRNYIYRFTDWGISRSTAGIYPTLLAAMGSRFERIPFFLTIFL